jgi:hypothetical protein
MALVIVLVVAVAGDRVAWWLTQDEALHQFTAQVPNVTGAQLHIGGFPFVTQLLSGRLEHVTGRAQTATLGKVNVSNVSVNAYGIQTDPPYRIDYGIAWGNITVETLTGLISEYSPVNVTVSMQDDALTIQTDLLGLTASIDVIPQVVARDSIGIQVLSARVGSQVVDVRELPLGIGDTLQSLHVGFQLPSRVSIDAAQILHGALRIQISGHDVVPEDLVGS